MEMSQEVPEEVNDHMATNAANQVAQQKEDARKADEGRKAGETLRPCVRGQEEEAEPSAEQEAQKKAAAEKEAAEAKAKEDASKPIAQLKAEREAAKKAEREAAAHEDCSK